MMPLKLKNINTIVFSLLTVLLAQSCQEPVKNSTDKLGNPTKVETIVDNIMTEFNIAKQELSNFEF